MVLYFFPPVGGIAASRAVRNVQHLPRFGWTPVVLTPRDASYELKDASMLEIVPPGTAIIRTRSLEAGHVRPWAVSVSEMVHAGRRRWKDLAFPWSHADPEQSSVPQLMPSGGPAGVLERLRRMVFFPDDQIGWLPFALLAALRRHRATPFDVVYSTSSPITSHLVAGALKRLTGVPWVAEFRDPWGGTALSKPLPWLHHRLRAKLERWMIRSADRVVFVAPSTSRMYQRRYPRATGFATIPNGYDLSEAAASLRAPAESDRFRIVYTGELFRPLELQTFLEGVDALLARRPELIEHLEIVFYGSVDQTCRQVADRLLARGRLGRVVEFRGFVPRQVALQAVADADAALVLLGAGAGMDVFIPGKVFDYLGQNRQILAMIPRGDARDLLDELGWGVIAEPEPADVERAVERLLTTPSPAGPSDPERKYERVALAKRLADALSAVTTPAPHEG